MKYTKRERKAFAQNAASYHTRLAEGYRRSAARAWAGRSTPERARQLEEWAAKAQRDAEYWAAVR